MVKKSIYKQTGTGPVPPHDAIGSALIQNRDNFIHYNIAHLRELIRNLSVEKFELFHTLPFLLHVNAPAFPGYIDHPLSTYGIYGFQDSGFWRMALNHFKYKEKDISPYLAKKFFIKGLYLMGSSGTLAQGDYSDFDYWVIVDKDLSGKFRNKLLAEKLTLIEQWSRDSYNQQVNFYIVRVDHIKHNEFTPIQKEDIGFCPKSFLKEEFYRTFIMIAGQLPYWVVLPVGLNDAQYEKWVYLSQSPQMPQKFNADMFVDLGNVAAVDRLECPETLIWHAYKAISDPVKSYIKACLVASYYADHTLELPCDMIKKRFSDRNLDSFMIDPYSIVFNNVLAYYQNQGNKQQTELLEESKIRLVHENYLGNWHRQRK